MFDKQKAISATKIVLLKGFLGAALAYFVAFPFMLKWAQEKEEVAYEKGIEQALDTVYKIVDRQVASDSTVTKLILVIDKDTLSYTLSKKTIK